jgi:beta-1,4-mannosyltransferase
VKPEDAANRLRVLAWPLAHPYTRLLYSHLAAFGVQIADFTVGRALRGGYDVFHAHWPEKALVGTSRISRATGASAALVVLEAARLHGARVVWTAHNARSHESLHARLEAWFWSAFVRRVDCVIHVSAAGQQAVEARYPTLAARPHAVVPLGHFRGAYPDRLSREAARDALAISHGAKVLTFFGQVRRYKNVPHLVRKFRALSASLGEVILLVAGAPHTPALAAEIQAAASGDPRVRLRLEHVSDEEVQHYMRAADLVVLPFTEITNSASAMLALSFDRPVLVPARGAMAELQAVVGRDWVYLYQGELTPDVLAGALQRSLQQPPGSAPKLDAFEWSWIARQTLSVYSATAAK